MASTSKSSKEKALTLLMPEGTQSATDLPSPVACRSLLLDSAVDATKRRHETWEERRDDGDGAGRACAMGMVRRKSVDLLLCCVALSGRVGEAIDLYLDLARVYKKFPHVHFKLGFLFLTLQDFQNAVQHFNIEIERYTANIAIPASLRGASVLGPGGSEKAGDAVMEPSDQQQQKQLHGESPVAPPASTPTAAHGGAVKERIFLFCACVGRSEAYSAVKETLKAENDLLFVANRGGNTKQILISMGVLFSHFGMHLRAEDCLERCAKIDANDPDYLIAHAELRLAQKRYVKAGVMFEKCRRECSVSSPTYHRALIGEGAALLRQNKLQDAVILLLQAMNNLRTCIRNVKDNESTAKEQSASSGLEALLTSTSSTLSPEERLRELVLLHHEATNLYGGVCLLKGELKAALDTYYSVTQCYYNTRKASPPSASKPSAAYERFQLPMLCVLPGTRSHRGDLVDTTKLSTKNLTEVLRHLDETELRYGPDPCLYFHRANVHRALGEFELFVHDLSLVESMDPAFVKGYIQRDFFGDFLDLDTISWIPLRFVEAIHGSLKRQEHMIPSAVELLKQPTSPRSPTATKSPLTSPSKPSKSRDNAAKATPMRQLPFISEYAIFQYFQGRVKHGNVLDEYAHVFQLDVFRRLPESRRNANWSSHLVTQHLSPWEGVVLDETTTNSLSMSKRPETATTTDAEYANPARELTKSVLSNFGRHPCVHMVAGIIELELFNASVAHIYFTEAINLINKQNQAQSVASNQAPAPASALSARWWQQRVMDRVKFYCHIWRSMASRIKIEMEKAVEDLNLAAAIKLEEQTKGGMNDPLLLVQRTLIMLLNGHLKPAFKLLHQLSHELNLTKKRRQKENARKSLPHDYEWRLIVDMFGNAGLNSFSLLPLTLEKESFHLTNASQSPSADPESVESGNNNNGDELDVHDDDDADADAIAAAAREEERLAAAIVKYALSKKTAGRGTMGFNVLQIETLDKFFESGLIKLSSSGSISQATPFFQAILSIDESYLPPTNFASLELLKCKEQDCMEEKLYNCFVRLGKRSRWLHKKVRWKFEAFIDANLAHVYLPSDMETLWHRARLLQDQRNYISAINDLSGCLELMSPQITWEKGKKSSSKVKAIFLNETKKTQWLQLLLERGCLEMTLEKWEKAIQDLTMVISQVGMTNPPIEASAYESRSTSLIHLNRFGHAIQDLQHLLEMNRRHNASPSPDKASSTAARGNPDSKQSDEHLLNCILIGNLYCQLALDQMKVSATASQKNTAFTPFVLEQIKPMHLNMGFLTKAAEYYDEALMISPEHFLVYYFRGRMLALSAQPKKATECLSDCLRRHPMFLPALFLRGCIYAQESLTILALADLYRVRHRAPSYPNLHTSIGFCHFDSGSLKKAVEALTEAVQQNPGDVDALYMRGCALQELFVLENAVKDFTHVLAIQPEHFRALYQRSVCRTLFQNYRDALDDLMQVIKVRPEWKEAWSMHAYASFCCGHYEDAIISYGKAIDLKDAVAPRGDNSGLTASQRDSQLFLHRSLANMYANHLQTALLDVDLALKRDHENYIGFVAKAFLLLKLGERDKVMQVLLHALPHYKRMRLMSPSDVIDSERDKMLQKTRDAQRSMSFVANSFTTNGSSGFPAAASAPSSSPAKKAADSSKDSVTKIAASAEVIFAFRKVAREEQEQRTQIYRQRHFTTAAKPLEPSEPPPVSSFGSPSRRISIGVSPAASPRKATLTLGAKIDSSDANLDQLVSASLLKRQARNAKFLRAIKKLTFEYRVLKALENATSAKYKKNEQHARVLSDLLQPKARVSWPKGTLTSNILVWAFNVLGTFHLGSHKVDDALMAFSLAIQAHPLNAVTYFNRGNAFLCNDVLAPAVSGFQDAIEVEETCFQAYNNMGVALFHQKRLDDAHDAFSSGLHHGDKDQKQKAVLLYNLGVVLQHLDKQDEAMEFYQQAIALDGSRAEFFNNRSSILHQQLRFSVALEDYNRALALEDNDGPENAENVDWLSNARGNKRIEARLNRAQLFITMGNCTIAMQDLHAVLGNLEMPSNIGPTRSIQVGGLAASPPSTSASSITAADKELAEEMLAFCFKWKAAMRIAVHDFLFGLDTFPCFRVFELFSFFGQQLTGHEEGDMDQRLVPLPIADASYFDYERAFGHWVCSDGERVPHDLDENDDECDDNVRQYKGQLLKQSYGEHLLQTMTKCHDGEFEDAVRCLLRAHYKTVLDSPDEYVLIIWRVQVLMQMETKDKSSSASETCALRAIALLEDFLGARQYADEETQTQGDDPMSAFLSAREPMRMPARSQRLQTVDDDEEELTERELQWQQQRRIIRADAYTFLGYLYQLHGQRDDAMKAFTHALRVRGDHVIALLNYLQLSIAEMEYEAALDCVLRVLELIFIQSGSGELRTDACKGLLDADRSVEAMFPALPALLADEKLSKCGVQMLQLLKEYRGLLSAHIQSNTAHIFRKQGALAHLVEEIRQILRQREAVAASMTTVGENEAEKGLDVLDLDELNRILDEYTASIVVQTQDHDRVENNADEASNQELHSIFLAELAQVCDHVAQSLPVEAQVSQTSQLPARLDLGNLDSLSGSETTIDDRALIPTKRNSPRSPSVAAVSQKRSNIVTTGLRRPTAASLSARPFRKSTIDSSLMETFTAASAAQSASATATLVKSTRDKDSSLLPQRPQSGPTALTRRQSRLL